MARSPRGGRTSRSASAAAPIDPKKVIRIPSDINQGLSSAKNATMIQILGMPRDHVGPGRMCRQVINNPLKSLIVTQSVGPFRVTGAKPAVGSLKSVLAKVKSAHPEVHDSLGTAGMLCVRRIRSSSRKLSNHSWGCAVDISIDGALDGLRGGPTGRNDGKTLAGLAAMAPFFNEEGWFWGVGFSSFEDGMHFEIADETIREWQASGKLGSMVEGRSTTPTNLSIGDQGAEVRHLQEALAARGFDIVPDGDFGPVTHGIVMDFQASEGIQPDGIVGAETREALGL